MDIAKIEAIVLEARSTISQVQTPAALEEVRIRLLGRKGTLSQLMTEVAQAAVAERPILGQAANRLKKEIEERLLQRQNELGAVSTVSEDPVLPGQQPELGHLHPISQFSQRMITIWRSLGYDIHEGPELEDQKYNFEGLNIPHDHPARDIHDTFFIKGHPNLVLRTHTSTVQLRSVLHQLPPLKFVEIGRVYRHEATDATHESMFTNCDGVVVGPGVNMANLVTTLKTFFRLLLGPNTKVRVRPSYFPFVEPGIEMDMAWTVQGRTRWLEVVGAGMMHPNVLKAMKLSDKNLSGFAFGMGVDRLMMLDYGIPDVRLSYSGNLDFLKQF